MNKQAFAQNQKKMYFCAKQKNDGADTEREFR
jgi:hypothetical protein